MRSIILFCLVFLCSTIGCCHADTQPYDDSKVITIEGIERSYYLHIPPLKDPKQKLPLIFVLHGAGSSGQQVAKAYGWSEKADQERFIVVYPSALPKNHKLPAEFLKNPTLWNDGNELNAYINDLAFLRGVYDQLTNQLAIDAKKVFCTGFSNGGSMCFRAGIALSDILCAIAPVSGPLSIKHLQAKRPISVLLIAGSADPLNPLKGGIGKTPWGELERPSIIASIEKWLPLIKASINNKTVETEGVVTTTKWVGATGKVAQLTIIDGQGHAWPGSQTTAPETIIGPNIQSINATNVIWDFFKKQAEAK